MKAQLKERLCVLRCNQSGQSMVILALSMSMFVGLAGIAVESGHAYFAYERLVASTNAATLAGAQAMPDTSMASANVKKFSSMAGEMNATPLLTNANVATTFLCLDTVSNTLKTPCQTSNGSAGGYNSIKVTQTAQVPSWFAGLFGINTFHLSYAAMAAMRGGTTTNWNIAIILDTTGSMNFPDSGRQCGGTQISCALRGVQALLSDLYPCGLGQNCTDSSTYVDDVSLYVFPPVLASTAGNDYCSGSSGGGWSWGGGGWSSSKPTTEYYSVPNLPSTWTYKIISFSNDYRTTDSATGLNTSSNLVKATGYSGSGCSGVYANGSTYYAQVIYMAQADLLAQQAANPGSRNAMIILSDGDATATVSYSGWGQQSISSTSWLQPSSDGSLNGISSHNPTSYTYPSAVGECGQAVVAAQSAADSGTVVYTIGYGSETSGCTSDRSYSASVTTGGGSWEPGGSPCQALAAMASAPINFYSDDGNGCEATVPDNQSITSLTAIFHQITAGLTAPRLIPNGTS